LNSALQSSFDLRIGSARPLAAWNNSEPPPPPLPLARYGRVETPRRRYGSAGKQRTSGRRDADTERPTDGYRGHATLAAAAAAAAAAAVVFYRLMARLSELLAEVGTLTE